MLTARQLYFEAVKVGDELPPLVKPPVDRLQIARYAGAAQDWNPLSVDEQYARNAGFPSALAPAMVSMGFLAELVTDWVRGARLRKFQARFVKIVWPGDVLTSRGRVVDRRFEAPGRYAIDVETWAENQRGELVVRGLATFQLHYNQDDEARQRAGQPPLVVTKEEEEVRLAKLSRSQPARPSPFAGRPLAPPKPLPAPLAPRPPEGVPARPASATVLPAQRVAPARSAARPAARKSAKAARKRRAAPRRGGAAGRKIATRRHAAKRPPRKEKSGRTRSRATARKPSGKKRR
jgi:acyl dehydratase